MKNIKLIFGLLLVSSTLIAPPNYNCGQESLPAHIQIISGPLPHGFYHSQECYGQWPIEPKVSKRTNKLDELDPESRKRTKIQTNSSLERFEKLSFPLEQWVGANEAELGSKVISRMRLYLESVEAKYTLYFFDENSRVRTDVKTDQFKGLQSLIEMYSWMMSPEFDLFEQANSIVFTQGHYFCELDLPGMNGVYYVGCKIIKTGLMFQVTSKRANLV